MRAKKQRINVMKKFKKHRTRYGSKLAETPKTRKRTKKRYLAINKTKMNERERATKGQVGRTLGTLHPQDLQPNKQSTSRFWQKSLWEQQ